MSKLQKIRKKRCLTQKELSDLSGVPFSILKKYESGEREIIKASAETLLRLATALTCPIEELLENEDKLNIQDSLMQKMYNEWRNEGIQAAEDSGLPFNYDCGLASAREDFAYYWSMEEEVDFKTMLKYEKRYDAENMKGSQND